MKPRVLGLIPARSGSKRIPKKNIYPVLGKPLIWYIIQAAKGSKTLDEIIVSTDSKRIVILAQKYGIEVPFLRPKKLAQDNTPDLPVFQHAIYELEKRGRIFDIIVNLRPTAALLRPEDIDNAVNLLIKTGADSVRSMHEAKISPYWMKIIDKKGQAHPFVPGKGETEYPTRQSLPQKIYELNGQVDVMRVNWIKKGLLYGRKMWPYVMHAEHAIDLDDPNDIYIIEAMLKVHQGYDK